MDHPGSRDLTRLLAYARAFETPSIWSPAIAVDRLLAAVADLVPGEIAVISIASQNVPMRTYATDDALATRRDAALDLWTECLDHREHPVISYHDDTGERRTVMVSDFVSRHRLRRTALFDYFWRPFAIDRTMGSRIDTPTGHVYLASYRSGLDFSERDRMMLDGLSAHAARLLRRSEVAELATQCRARFGLTAREAEILAWAIRGRTVPTIASLLVLSPATVKTHLHNIYRKTGWRSRAAATGEFYAAGMSDNGRTGTHGARSGLTAREASVMLAVAHGETNAQIATSLRVSLETAKTHLRHAYRKLEASNRAEAVARFLDQ